MSIRFDHADKHPATTLESTIPIEFSGASFDMCPDLPERAVEFARSYAADPRGFFCLTGSYGSGKSWLMACVGNAIVTQHNPTVMTAVWLDAPTLQGAMEMDYGTMRMGWRGERAMTTPFLLLDDFLACPQDKHTLRVWDSIFDARYKAGLATMVTTNETPESMGRMGMGRIASRMQRPHGIKELNRDDDLRIVGTIKA